MQDPKKEIVKIVQTLCMTRDATELEETVDKYFLPDAKFSHPLCIANSRNEILGVFQWYRLASPKTSIEVSNIMFESESNVLVFDVRETYHAWFNPLPSKPGRVLVRLKLQRANGYYRIQREEDLVHPMDQVGFFASPLVPLVAMSLWLGCLLSNLGACVFRSVGFNSGLKGGHVSLAGLLDTVGLGRAAVKSNGRVKNN